MVIKPNESTGAQEIAGQILNKDLDSPRAHLLQEYLTAKEPSTKLTERVPEITARQGSEQAGRLQLAFSDSGRAPATYLIRDGGRGPQNVLFKAQADNTVANGSQPLGSPNRLYPGPEDHMERMAQDYVKMMDSDISTEHLPGRLLDDLKGLSPARVENLLERIRYLQNGRRPYIVPELPSKTNERGSKPEDLMSRATTIKDKINAKDMDGARVDLVESYLKMPQTDFIAMSNELKRQTAGTATPFNVTWTHGNVTDASLADGRTFKETFISADSKFNAPKTPLQNKYLEGIAVKFSNLMEEAHRPDAIGQALVKVAQSLPKDEAKQLLDRVMEINVHQLANQYFVPFWHKQQSPELRMEFSDLDRDGKAEELSGLKLNYSLLSLTGVPLYHSMRGSIPSNFYTGTVDVFTPATKGK